jgi:hypothetical protein
MVSRFGFIIISFVSLLCCYTIAKADEIRDMAITALAIAQPNSFKNNIEYCGLIGYHRSGALLFSPPIPGFKNSCNPGLNPWAWREVVATYHTHGAHTYDSDAEVPSLEDMLADFAEGTDGYIATPSGRVWHVSVKDRKAYLLCDVGCITSDQRYRECEGLKPASEYTLKTLKQRIDEDEVVCE